ncbi:MAG: hypothetical protein WAL22_09390 [Solirubrobacteraceae bacterium]
MSFPELHSWSGRHFDWPGHDDGHVYTLLEEARLRCEELTLARTGPTRGSLREIHHELGMAGWHAGSALDCDRRLALLAGAHQRSTTAAMLHPPGTPHALAAVAIIADDALSGTPQTDDMHLAHLHLLSAMGLLANHL